MNKDLFKPIKDPVKFFEKDAYNTMPAKELINRIEKMVFEAEKFNPDDAVVIPFSTCSDDGVFIMFPNIGSIAPSNIKEYIRKTDDGILFDNEIRVSDYTDILNKAIKELKKVRSRSVRFSFVNLVKYGVILGIPDYGYTNIGDIRSFVV